jgi:hypothetical protein
LRRVTRSLATTAWPVEPALVAGFATMEEAMVPFLGVHAFVPLFFSAGPVVSARAWFAGSDRLSLVEGMAGVGVGWQAQAGDAIARVSVVPSVLWSSWWWDDTDDTRDDRGATWGPAMSLQLEAALPLGGGTSVSGRVEPVITRAVAHRLGDTVLFARSEAFLLLGVGIDFGGPVD